MALPVLVLNRAVDTERLALFRASAEAHGIAFERIAAFDAHAPGFPFARYADLIGDIFWGAAQAKPGAIGCFLSHRHAWQTVRDRGWAACLICEDDAVFHQGLAALDRLAARGPDADVVFVNDRMAAWARAAGGDAGDGVDDMERAATLAEVVSALAARGGPKAVGAKPAPGADAYLVSGSGARRLLELTARQRIRCGVDWAMVRAALPGIDAAAARTFPELGLLHDLASDPPLLARVLSRPVAGQAGGLPSTIRHRVTAPISELKARG